MDLLKLERMVAIYEAGSFRKAAKELGMSQPTLTWSIHQLEESLNARLFERGPRGIVPTDLCERLVRRARLIFREQERMLDEVEGSGRHQTINLGVHSIFLTTEFAQCMADFSEKWPGTTIRIREGFSSDLIERMLRGELDFACCALPDEAEHGGALLVEPRAMLNYSVVAHQDHPIFTDIADDRPIAEYRWVEFDTAIVGAFPGHNDIAAIMADAGREVARKSVRTVSLNLIKLLVTKGQFIGLIADEIVAQELASGVLKRLPGTSVTASQFGLVSLKDDFETTAVRALKDLLDGVAFEPLRRLN